MPDPTSRIRFSFVFPKKAWIILCKTDSDLTWMTWSWIGQTHMVWKHAGVQESLGLGFGRKQPAHYQFSCQTQLCSSTDVSDHIVQNQPGSDLDDLAGFWPNASGPEASRCARIIGPGSGFWQNANGPLPVSHFPDSVAFFHRQPTAQI